MAIVYEFNDIADRLNKLKTPEICWDRYKAPDMHSKAQGIVASQIAACMTTTEIIAQAFERLNAMLVTEPVWPWLNSDEQAELVYVRPDWAFEPNDVLIAKLKQD